MQGDDGPLFIMERGNRQELDAKEPDNPSLSILHFERYTLDLAANAEPPGERSPKPKEQYVHELLDPPASLSEARRNGRIAEGHKRLTWPLQRAGVRADRARRAAGARASTGAGRGRAC